MILCREDILYHYNKGNIVIDPFDPSLVNVNSVNVRLGPDMWVLTDDNMKYRDLYAPERQRDRAWRKLKPIKAGFLRRAHELNDWALGIVPDHADVFLLQPRSFYLATTFEKIGSVSTTEITEMDRNKSIIPKMSARSTFGRHGLSVALCAGLGDSGYRSRWALEVQVQGTPGATVPLAVGTPIGQVVFHYGTPSMDYYGGNNHYQDGNSVKFLPKGLGWSL